MKLLVSLLAVLFFSAPVGAEPGTTSALPWCKRMPNMPSEISMECDEFSAPNGRINCTSATWTWALKTTLEVLGDVSNQYIECLVRDIKIEDERSHQERVSRLSYAKMVLDQCGVKGGRHE